ncbi:hypothetical protein R69746_08808 [Paraburkholderia aspalathi]|nr:hypothetical protein [Paraburkholderia aspalathi]CAE6876481.1 hypothetical protein R69746_08808 [Paraburkholderia aspalathi]
MGQRLGAAEANRTTLALANLTSTSVNENELALRGARRRIDEEIREVVSDKDIGQLEKQISDWHKQEAACRAIDVFLKRIDAAQLVVWVKSISNPCRARRWRRNADEVYR